MLTVKREGTKLVVLLGHGLGGGVGHSLELDLECSREIHAAALEAAVQKHVADTVQGIRREEYAAGYRDGRRKLGKRDIFLRVFGALPDWMKERTR